MEELKSLLPSEDEALRAATMAHKEILLYVQKNIIKIKDIEEISKTNPHIKDLLNKIKIGREIAHNRKYFHFQTKVKIHPRKTKRGVSKKVERRERRKAESERLKTVFEYPEIGRPLNKTEQELYRTLLVKNLNSGMDREKAISITLKHFTDKLSSL